jgi:hypothetical protein
MVTIAQTIVPMETNLSDVIKQNEDDRINVSIVLGAEKDISGKYTYILKYGPEPEIFSEAPCCGSGVETFSFDKLSDAKIQYIKVVSNDMNILEEK